ncbi:MAG: hypothetical protein KC589_07855 [Nanoarchaeota archaeon]|nr:hypothetical protein [Nanoarchaeota archaeon]
MKINEIKVTRKFNLGNYESMDISVSVAPSPEEEDKSIKELITKLDQEITETKNILKENGRL